jgi:hypothetical protein
MFRCWEQAKSLRASILTVELADFLGSLTARRDEIMRPGGTRITGRWPRVALAKASSARWAHIIVTALHGLLMMSFTQVTGTEDDSRSRNFRFSPCLDL